MRDDDAVVHACRILARPCPCPLDHRTPVPAGRPCPVDPHARTSVPARSPHARACWIPMHARLCPLDPRTPVPAGSPHAHARWIPTHARVRAHRIPTPARVRARWIPTPARVRARWIPTHARTHPPGPCTPAGCACTALTALARTVPTPARSWGPHALTRCPHARARRIPERYVVMGEGYCSSSSSCRTVL